MNLLTWLQAMPNPATLRSEFDKLVAIKEWAIGQIGFAPGDIVEFVEAPNTNNGWSPYREALHVGARAIVSDVDFSGLHGYWYASIVLEREWSVGPTDRGPMRFWSGPVDETPDGMKPPSPYDQEHYPQGRKHTFSMPVRLLAKATI